MCDYEWNLNAAHIVCRSIGYGGAEKAVPGEVFGQGTGDIVMAHVECLGRESTIFDCSYNEIDVYKCDHSNDAGVICRGKKI